MLERDLEKGLIDQIRHFLLELGQGFSSGGKQFRLQMGQSEFFLDLLFNHLSLRCYVVVELKTASFQPEFAGKLNLYAVHDKEHPTAWRRNRRPNDQTPTT